MLHAPALISQLDDSNPRVRQRAVETLGKLEAATLAQHAAAIVATLDDSDSDAPPPPGYIVPTSHVGPRRLLLRIRGARAPRCRTPASAWTYNQRRN